MQGCASGREVWLPPPFPHVRPRVSLQPLLPHNFNAAGCFPTPWSVLQAGEFWRRCSALHFSYAPREKPRFRAPALQLPLLSES